MVTKAQKVRVIILISIVTLISVYILFLLVGNKLFTQKDIYYIKFTKQSVTGLNIGQDVRYYGINIGKVTDITFNEKDISEIIIRIDVKKGTPIKKTVKANLTYIGITGLKQIELVGGENEDEDLPPESYIVANKSIMDDISGKAEVISEKFERVLNNIINITNTENQAELTRLLKNINTLSENTDSILTILYTSIKANRPNLEKLVKDVDKLSLTLNDIAKELSININALVTDGHKLIKSPELANMIKNAEGITTRLNNDNLSKTLINLNDLLIETRNGIAHLDRTVLSGRKNFLKSMNLLKETMENINDFVIMIKDNPDMLIKGKDNEFE